MDNLNINKKIGRADKKNSAKRIMLSFLNNITITVILIIVMVLAIGYYFFLSPKYGEIKAIESVNINEQEMKYQTKVNELAAIEKVKSEYRAVPISELDKINFIFPSEPDKKELFGYVDKIIERNGFVLPSLSIEITHSSGAGSASAISNAANAGTVSGNILNNKEIGIIKISFSISGVNYQGLKNLLNQIENDLRLFDVSKIDYDPEDGSLLLEMNTYYRMGQ